MDKFLDVFALIKVFADQLRSKTFIKDQAVIVLIEAIHIDAHKTEKFRVDQLLVAELNSNHTWKDLAKIHFHFFWFFEK